MDGPATGKRIQMTMAAAAPLSGAPRSDSQLHISPMTLMQAHDPPAWSSARGDSANPQARQQLALDSTDTLDCGTASGIDESGGDDDGDDESPLLVLARNAGWSVVSQVRLSTN